MAGAVDRLFGLAEQGLGHWIDQDTERSTVINNSDPYRQTLGGQTVPAPGSDRSSIATSVATAVQNPWVLLGGVLVLIGIGYLVSRR